MEPAAAEPPVDATSRCRTAKSERIDLGLAVLAVRAEPRPYSQDEIACWCGCSRKAIAHIERAALAKVARRIGREALGELLRMTMDAREAAHPQPHTTE